MRNYLSKITGRYLSLAFFLCSDVFGCVIVLLILTV